MSTINLLTGDSLLVLANLEANSVDSIVTDAPYGLSFMGKKWDYEVPSVDIWRQALRVLKPGGHLLCFGGTRTYHRLVVNIEDAGFEIRDQIQWLYGSGFPKSMNLKDENKGWGSALKPANEPICVARKPLEKGLTLAANVLKYGTGAINIDESRIGTEKRFNPPASTVISKSMGRPEHSGSGFNQDAEGKTVEGRWPANIILDEVAAEMLNEQSGVLKSGDLKPYKRKHTETVNFKSGCEFETANRAGDSGGASRFFYVAKASKRERGEGNVHPTVKPIKLMEYLIRLVTPAGGTTLDPFMGSGSTGVAAKNLGYNFIGIELNEEYTEIAKKRIEA